MKQILVVDDDPQIRTLLQIALEKADYRVQMAADGQAALDQARRDPPDVIILDIGLPEMDGLQVCQKLRQTQQTPIIFLTARDDEIDRILGFEMGGDDYVTKPFSPRELVARVGAVLRRSGGVAQPHVLRRGVLVLQPTLHKCQVANRDLALTSTEMAILSELMGQPDTPIARPRLTDRVYGVNIHVSDRTMDSHLRNLRAKLAAAGCADAIETVHGVGVRMGSCSAA
ncbi:response regulator transcription factor [Algirhabdus cladophorae]|uniref:response regulator transcription factor n=1 Tax=Algirhabdus cladophorae TaxID=3377108 RepID=UPI003B84A8AA